MIENVIHVRASVEAIQAAIARIPETARAGGATASAMMTRCGMAALGRIKDAFIVKSRGGTDEAGDSWPKLSPKTIAYSRRHPGVPKAAIRAKDRPSWLLTKKQRERWWDLYRQGLRIFNKNKASAAKRAWAISKVEGAVTLFDKYSTTAVDILRDTGLLFNSLSPGVASNERVFRVVPGEAIVGTNRVGAKAHHEGIPGRLPQRRLWPEPDKWPSSWWVDILEQLQMGLLDIAAQLLRGIT